MMNFTDTNCNFILGFKELGVGGYDWSVKCVLQVVVNPSLCIIGLIGNLLNIVVLSRGRMQEAMSRGIEKSSRLGLMGLAVTDMFCCAGSFMYTISGQERALFVGADPRIYVLQYGPYFLNACMKASTWLTVILAVERYVAICHPLKARYMVNVRTTRVAICLTFLLTCTLALPTIWTFDVWHFSCNNSNEYHIIDEGLLIQHRHRLLRNAFTYFWAVIGFLIPAAILAYCNIRLIRALRESFRMGRMYRANFRSSSEAASNRLTLTLISIVCMFLVLFTPSELLHMFFGDVTADQEDMVSMMIIIANILRTANFAFNFVLYCVVNVQFRNTWRDIMFCVVQNRKRLRRSAAGSGSGAIRTVQEMTAPYTSQKNNTMCISELACM